MTTSLTSADVGFRGAWGDQGDGTYVNSILPGDYSDIDAIRVGDDYYMISSTMQYSPGMVVLHSKDLVNWRIIGHAVDDVSSISSKLNHTEMNAYGKGIWAGSLQFCKGRFWVYFGSPEDGYFMTNAVDAAGPWSPLTKVTYDTDPTQPGAWWDDCATFYDVESDTVYFVGTNFTNYDTHLFELSEDGTQLITATDALIYSGQGAEANKIFTFEGTYYIFHSKHIGGRRDVFMLRSDSIWGTGGSPGHPGTYEEKQLSRSVGDDREPNQGGLIQIPSGEWYFVTHHGELGLEGRLASLLPVTWVDGWPVIGADEDNDAMGEIVWRGPKPIAGFPIVMPQSDDEFDGPDLEPQWEWNYQPRADKWSLAERPGYMRLHALKPLSSGDLMKAPNVLTQRYMRTEFGIVETKLDIGGMVDGQSAGLAHISGGGGAGYSWIGVVQKAGARTVTFRDTTGSGTVLEGLILPEAQTSIWLKSTMNDSRALGFEYSLDGASFEKLGGAYEFYGHSYRGTRLALFSYNDSGEHGYVDVDYFRYNYAAERAAG